MHTSIGKSIHDKASSAWRAEIPVVSLLHNASVLLSIAAAIVAVIVSVILI